MKTFKPRSQFRGHARLLHEDNLQRSLVGSTQLRLMHSSVRTAVLMCVLTSLCVFLPMWTLSCWQFTSRSLVQRLGLPTGTLIWKTRLWTRLWTYLSPQMKYVHTLCPFLSRSILCTLPWYRSAFVSLSKHYIWVCEAICIASWGPWRTKKAIPGGTGTMMHLSLTTSLEPMGTGWVPTA